MSNRLDDLRRQRDLVQQHLAWLDAEIAQAAQPACTLPAPHSRSQPIPADVEHLIAAEAQAPANSAAQAKRGCFIAFGLLLAATAGAVLALYLYSRARH